MTIRKRRTYTKEFKLEAIQLVKTRDCSVSETAEHLGIDPHTLYRWIREHEADPEHSFPGLGNLKEPEAELQRLRKKLADTEMERDILKKALAFFSKTSR